MLAELNTPGWEKAFDGEFVRHIRITREDVAEIIAMAVPDHETTGGCELLCSEGYLGFFKLKGGWFAVLKADCDGNADASDAFLLGSDYDRMLSQLCILDRERLGLATEADRQLLESDPYSDA